MASPRETGPHTGCENGFRQKFNHADPSMSLRILNHPHYPASTRVARRTRAEVPISWAFVRPIFVNHQNCQKRTIEEIGQGEYTHVLSSPELFTGPVVRDTLHDPSFCNRVKWVVLDEVHLVSTWSKSFRNSYARLNSMRTAVSAISLGSPVRPHSTTIHSR